MPSAGSLWTQLLVSGLGWLLAALPAGQPAAELHHVLPVRGPVDYGSVHHDYPATDMFADCGSPVVAPVAGVVLEVSRADAWDPVTNRGAARGGKFVAIRGLDGVRYYGSHLARVAPSVEPGALVYAGQRVGRVGHTGSARSTPCHLHFGISPACRGSGQWWIRRGVVGPYRFLERWRSGRRGSPADAVARWSREHGCPTRP
ncbi:MAG TPA: M23 family metallopeptidase [Nocardioidaceae bacterium]|nr:M23 family metallopeptidase [Nocardioidaceae bacterium]